MSKRRVIYGALAALFAALVASDASFGKPYDYPVLHKLFDGDWTVARNAILGIASPLTAVFGFLAINVGAGADPPKQNA